MQPIIYFQYLMSILVIDILIKSTSRNARVFEKNILYFYQFGIGNQITSCSSSIKVSSKIHLNMNFRFFRSRICKFFRVQLLNMISSVTRVFLQRLAEQKSGGAQRQRPTCFTPWLSIQKEVPALAVESYACSSCHYLLACTLTTV